MYQILTPDGRAIVGPWVFYMNAKGASRAAARLLGRDWQARGYRVEWTDGRR